MSTNEEQIVQPNINRNLGLPYFQVEPLPNRLVSAKPQKGNRRPKSTNPNFKKINKIWPNQIIFNQTKLYQNIPNHTKKSRKVSKSIWNAQKYCATPVRTHTCNSGIRQTVAEHSQAQLVWKITQNFANFFTIKWLKFQDQLHPGQCRTLLQRS